MEEKKDQVMAEIYQHLCDCQDLSVSIGEWDLMYTFKKMRYQIDHKRLG